MQESRFCQSCGFKFPYDDDDDDDYDDDDEEASGEDM